MDDDMIKKARQLLLLTDLVEKYPQVIARRVSGLVYILIAGGISFATLIFMSLQNILGPGDPFLVNVGFVLLSLGLSWVIGFRLIVPLTRSYQEKSDPSKADRKIYALWTVLCTAIVITSLITFQIGQAQLFPPALQIVMAFGFTMNYLFGRRTGSELEFFSKEQLYFAIAILLGVIPMLVFPQIAFLVLIVVNMGGIYVIGIYMLISAEQLLLESKGQG